MRGDFLFVIVPTELKGFLRIIVVLVILLRMGLSV